MHPLSLKEHITLNLPSKIRFGVACSKHLIDDTLSLDKRKAFIVLSGSVEESIRPILDTLKEEISVNLWMKIDREPTVRMFEEALIEAQKFNPDIVIGIGGGSVLDVAKLIAALAGGKQHIKDVWGIGKLNSREIYLTCLPTTSGTGSEVSPNSILLDEDINLKKGIISPHLIPDATYVDPELTKTVPPSVTAATGLDALTHCIEAYANRFAHPMIDLFALEGIRLIGANLQYAVERGQNIKARTKMALGSLYGGVCLGPVNTAAVHALSYPLGSEYHIPHGISNAVLLPHVIEFNLKAAPARYAKIAEALNVKGKGESDMEIAQKGVARIKKLMRNCSVDANMSSMGIPQTAIKSMAESAMSVTRLLKNNVRNITREDAEKIYEAAY